MIPLTIRIRVLLSGGPSGGRAFDLEVERFTDLPDVLDIAGTYYHLSTSQHGTDGEWVYLAADEAP